MDVDPEITFFRKIHLNQNMVEPKYTPQEDAYLKAGLIKYGKGNWSRILRDPEYQFHTERTRDGLRMRAGTLKLVKRRDKSNCAAAKSKEQRLSSRGLSSSK